MTEQRARLLRAAVVAAMALCLIGWDWSELLDDSCDIPRGWVQPHECPEGTHRKKEKHRGSRESVVYRCLNREGLPHGPTVEWDCSGSVYETHYRDGEKHGLYIRYYGARHPDYRAEEGQHLDGKRHGVWVAWYQPPQKLSQRTFVEGKAEGVMTSWYRSGAKQEERHFRSGRLEVPVVRWYEDGGKEYEGSHREGKQHGRWTFWYEDGQLKKIVEYQDGQEISREVFWQEWEIPAEASP